MLRQLAQLPRPDLQASTTCRLATVVQQAQDVITYLTLARNYTLDPCTRKSRSWSRETAGKWMSQLSTGRTSSHHAMPAAKIFLICLISSVRQPAFRSLRRIPAKPRLTCLAKHNHADGPTNCNCASIEWKQHVTQPCRHDIGHLQRKCVLHNSGMKTTMVGVLGRSCSFATQLLTWQLAEGLDRRWVRLVRNLSPKDGMYPGHLSRKPLPGHAGSCAWCEGLHIKVTITKHGSKPTKPRTSGCALAECQQSRQKSLKRHDKYMKFQ